MIKRIYTLCSIVIIHCAGAVLAISSRQEMPMKYFTMSEFLRSNTALRLNIDNTPQAHHIANLRRLVNIVLDPAREQLGCPIFVNSGFRCYSLNKAVGGAPKSFHLQGRAADVTTRNLRDNMQLYLILDKLPHTELIWEQNGLWIHVAL